MPRRVRVAVLAASCLLLLPAVAIAASGFTDVPASNVHLADIEWLADADVTKGCNPPDNDRFCPDDNVTRAQMASFLRRLATNGAVEQVGDTSAEQIAESVAASAAALPGYDGYFAYAWVDGTAVSGSYMFNPTGDITVTNPNTGMYQVTFGGDHPRIRNVSVTGYGTDPIDCKVAWWSDDTVNVVCFAVNGASENSRFTIWVTG